jgi:16S rRNA (adenine1518-N6/adenine1519-N6)-dimethyltransferase
MKTSRRHALGQHFLAAPGILARIAAAVDPQPDEFVLEIGAGKGALTLPLAASGAKIVAVEVDPPLAAELRAKQLPNVFVVEGDVLLFDWTELLRRHGAPPGPITIAGNLPYSISSPLLFRVAEDHLAIRRVVFLVQRETAERITAGPGSKSFAPLGILLQIYFAVRVLFKVAPGSFVPPPKVDSAVVLLERRETPLLRIEDERAFRRFVHACFAQRRKTLANNLAAAGYPHERVAATLSDLGLDPKVRAEQIPIADLSALHGGVRS